MVFYLYFPFYDPEIYYTQDTDTLMIHLFTEMEVTIQVVPNLLLTSKLMLRFSKCSFY